MSGFGKGDGVFHCLAVANLTDQNHVWRLAQGIFQGIVPIPGIDADLALIDDRLLVPVHILHRVLDGDNVAGAVAVAVVNQRCQGCRLTGAGRTHEQHQAALAHHDFGKNLRQAQILVIGYFSDDVARDDADLVALHENVHPKAAGAGDGRRQVHLELLLEVGLLSRVHQLVGNLLDLSGLQPLAGNRPQLPLKLGAGRCPGTQEEIRSALGSQRFKPFGNPHSRPLLAPRHKPLTLAF